MPKYFVILEFSPSSDEICLKQTALLKASSIEDVESNLKKLMASKFKNEEVRICYISEILLDFTENENPSRR